VAAAAAAAAVVLLVAAEGALTVLAAADYDPAVVDWGQTRLRVHFQIAAAAVPEAGRPSVQQHLPCESLAAAAAASAGVGVWVQQMTPDQTLTLLLHH
jgi:hypothetical protein